MEDFILAFFNSSGVAPFDTTKISKYFVLALFFGASANMVNYFSLYSHDNYEPPSNLEKNYVTNQTICVHLYMWSKMTQKRSIKGKTLTIS